MFRDMNGDGAPDLYVCNDFESPDRIWINDGHGQFRASAQLALRSTQPSSPWAWISPTSTATATIDFFVADMLSRSHRLKNHPDGRARSRTCVDPGYIDDRPQIRRNTLFLNRGDGTFAEIANYAGPAASDWTWCVAFLDVDLDGYEDLLVANGHAFDIQDIDATERIQTTGPPTLRRSGAGTTSLQFPPLRTPNYAFRNQGDLTFEEAGAAWGFDSTAGVPRNGAGGPGQRRRPGCGRELP